MFVNRYQKERQNKKIDNSSLYAGSPMYYYCKGCTALVATLPESHINAPPRYCHPCKILHDHGLIEPLKKLVDKNTDQDVIHKQIEGLIPHERAQNQQTQTLHLHL